MIEIMIGGDKVSNSEKNIKEVKRLNKQPSFILFAMANKRNSHRSNGKRPINLLKI